MKDFAGKVLMGAVYALIGIVALAAVYVVLGMAYLGVTSMTSIVFGAGPCVL